MNAEIKWNRKNATNPVFGNNACKQLLEIEIQFLYVVRWSRYVGIAGGMLKRLWLPSGPAMDQLQDSFTSTIVDLYDSVASRHTVSPVEIRGRS